MAYRMAFPSLRRRSELCVVSEPQAPGELATFRLGGDGSTSVLVGESGAIHSPIATPIPRRGSCLGGCLDLTIARDELNEAEAYRHLSGNTQYPTAAGSSWRPNGAGSPST